jgi:hypothetical protein
LLKDEIRKSKKKDNFKKRLKKYSQSGLLAKPVT